MNQPPRTYAEWAQILKQFGAGGNDEEIIAVMKAGALEWQSGVADRFARRLAGALDQRIKTALDRFDSDMKRASHPEEGYVRSLNALNHAFVLARMGADLPCIPEEQRRQVVEMVESAAATAQQSLEDSAHVIDRSGRIASLVRNHAVNRF